MADNPTQPALINESEARGLFEQAAMETGAVTTIEDFETFKRYLDEQYLLWLCSLTKGQFYIGLLDRIFFCLECCCLKS
jgi:hypothetical protein